MPTDPKTLSKGMQIAYVPTHANGNIAHPDVEFGFVTSVTDNGAFCRYFYRNGELRTKSNSELTSYDNLYRYKSRGQEVVDALMDQIDP